MAAKRRGCVARRSAGADQSVQPVDEWSRKRRDHRRLRCARGIDPHGSALVGKWWARGQRRRPTCRNIGDTLSVYLGDAGGVARGAPSGIGIAIHTYIHTPLSVRLSARTLIWEGECVCELCGVCGKFGGAYYLFLTESGLSVSETEKECHERTSCA